jgi:GSH-dependent disulfide-bond oxidoreductase
MYSWLMFVATGIGPYCGQAVHFKHVAPEPKEYAVNGYTFEPERHWNIVEAHLAGKQWMVGDTYTLVDMAVWGWARMVPRFLGDGLRRAARCQAPPRCDQCSPRRAARRGAEEALHVQG